MISTDAVLTLITQQGPCVPADLTQVTQTDSIILGAVFASLVEQKKIKITQLKWGGSPLYYAPGQEDLIQKLYTKLNDKDKRAYDLLKQEGLLRDDELTPLQRTCLRNLPDFAIQLKVTHQEQSLIFWRWYLYPHDVAITQITNILQPAQIPLKEPQQQQLPIQPPIPQKDRAVLASQTIAEVPTLADDSQEVVAQTSSVAVVKAPQSSVSKSSAVPSVPTVSRFQTPIEKPLPEKPLQPSAEVSNLESAPAQHNQQSAPAIPTATQKHVIAHTPIRQPTAVTQVVSDSFVLQVQNTLYPSTIRQVVIQKKQTDFDATVDLQTQFGVVICSLKAKQKKKHSDADLAGALNAALLSHQYCVYAYTGELTKKALAFSQQHPILLIHISN
jgi:hypothetical protein